MYGAGGDDVYHIGGGLNQIFGGTGDDAFHIDLVAQNTSIIGDNEVSVDGQYVNPSLKEDGLPDYDTVNTNYSDAAYFSFEWPTLIDNPDFNPNAVEDASNPRYLKDPDSYIEQLGKGHFKVHHKLENGEEINVEMYDVEGAYFSDGEGGLEYHALTSGRPITSDDFGNLAYDRGDVKFWVEHDDADYGGATTIAVVTTATKTVTDPVTKQKISYEEPSVKWKGLATEADSFVFSDVTINVINVAQTDLTGVPIDDTTVYGTSGIDLIIGDDSDNLIYGGANNDIIFGGAGNDEIYGEGGDDVIIGGVGEDILYGDYHEDALKPAEELDSKGKLMNASELDGDDIIVGGAGIDKIDSGEGQNIAASGDLSSVILNAELDEMHTFLDYDEDDLPV
jgi:Ca2+-binding RTX toxin-like protein